MRIEYKKLPSLYDFCRSVGHDLSHCKRKAVEEQPRPTPKPSTLQNGKFVALIDYSLKRLDNARPTSPRPQIGNSNLVKEEGQNGLSVGIGQQPSAQEASSSDTKDSNLQSAIGVSLESRPAKRQNTSPGSKSKNWNERKQ